MFAEEILVFLCGCVVGESEKLQTEEQSVCDTLHDSSCQNLCHGQFRVKNHSELVKFN